MVATSITMQSIRASIIFQTHKFLDELTATALVRRVRRMGGKGRIHLASKGSFSSMSMIDAYHHHWILFYYRWGICLCLTSLIDQRIG